MTALRRLILGHHRVAGMLLALALCVKLLVPGGYMPVAAGGSIMVSICTGTAPATMMVAMPGMTHHESDGSSDHRKAQMPCAFSGLGFVSLAAADPVLLAAALLFVMAIGMAAAPRMSLPAWTYVRPPLRGPPAAA